MKVIFLVPSPPIEHRTPDLSRQAPLLQVQLQLDAYGLLGSPANNSAHIALRVHFQLRFPVADPYP